MQTRRRYRHRSQGRSRHLNTPDTIEHHPDRKDSARFRWLTEDHADPTTRASCREILERLPVMGYGAAVQLIDDAMAAPVAVGAV